MKHFAMGTIVALVLVLFPGVAAATSQVPNGSITVDGEPSDWSGITPAVIDNEGDSCGADCDIKAVYSAMDDTNAYFLIETYGVPILSVNTTVEIDFDYQPWQLYYAGYRADIHLLITISGLSAWKGYDPNALEEVSITGEQVAWGDTLEVSIPLSQLGNPGYFEPTFVNIWNQDVVTQNGCDPTQIRPAQGIESMYVQRRNYENGVSFNRLYFYLYDRNQTPPGDVLSNVVLYDPNGSAVDIPPPVRTTSNIMFGSYDASTGQWGYAPGFDFFDNSYSSNFSEDIVEGYYRLSVETTGGHFDERTFRARLPVDGPTISASSFRAWKDDSGNLIWTWDPPFGIDLSLRTRVSAYVGVAGHDEHFAWVTVPTHMGGLTLPKNKLDQLEAFGSDIEFSLSLRFNDEYGYNFQRNISNGVSLDEAMEFPPKGDINGDGVIGLEEAIHALQAVSGR